MVKGEKIPCYICGEKKWAGEPRLSKLIEKFGSRENLFEKYVCRKCRKKEKVEEVQKKETQEE